VKYSSIVWNTQYTLTASIAGGYQSGAADQKHLINWSSASVSTYIRGKFSQFAPLELSSVCRHTYMTYQGQTSAMILLLLPINLRRVIRLFPNNLEFIILRWERLFTTGKRLRQFVNVQITILQFFCSLTPLTVV